MDQIVCYEDAYSFTQQSNCMTPAPPFHLAEWIPAKEKKLSVRSVMKQRNRLSNQIFALGKSASQLFCVHTRFILTAISCSSVILLVWKIRMYLGTYQIIESRCIGKVQNFRCPIQLLLFVICMSRFHHENYSPLCASASMYYRTCLGSGELNPNCPNFDPSEL